MKSPSRRCWRITLIGLAAVLSLAAATGCTDRTPGGGATATPTATSATTSPPLKTAQQPAPSLESSAPPQSQSIEQLETRLRDAGFNLVNVTKDDTGAGNFHAFAAVMLPHCHQVVKFGIDFSKDTGPNPVLVLHPLNADGDTLEAPPTAAQEAHYCQTIH